VAHRIRADGGDSWHVKVSPTVRNGKEAITVGTALAIADTPDSTCLFPLTAHGPNAGAGPVQVAVGRAMPPPYNQAEFNLFIANPGSAEDVANTTRGWRSTAIGRTIREAIPKGPGGRRRKTRDHCPKTGAV